MSRWIPGKSTSTSQEQNYTKNGIKNTTSYAMTSIPPTNGGRANQCFEIVSDCPSRGQEKDRNASGARGCEPDEKDGGGFA